MSALVLKIIAEIVMFGDHFAVSMWDTVGMPWSLGLYWVIRSAARIAFPIFGFQLSEGVRHSSNRLKYFLRLLIFLVVSEPFFDRALFGHWFDPYHQNVYATLALGFLVMAVLKKSDEKEGSKKLPWILLAGFTCLVGAFFAEEYFYTDYGKAGVFMLGVFSVNALDLPNIRKNPRRETVFRAAVYLAAFLVLLAGTNSVERWAFFGVIPVALYSGERGRMTKKLRILFYAFYPLHLAILSVAVVLLQ